MLPIEELVGFGRGLDSDYRHPVASELGSRWGTTPPRFVRSSATHVFVADRDGGDRLVLRLRPGDELETLRRAAWAAREWSAAGAPMVSAVPSLEGRTVESFDGYAAMALEVAEGPTLDELGGQVVDHAADWGEALALLHTVRLEPSELPDSPDLPLPRDPAVYGTLHGDPESDNILLSDDGLRFVDPDEVRRGWFAADIAFALRDWAAPGRAPDLSADVPRRFVEGYRRVRAVSEEELSWMPLLAAEAGRRELAAHEGDLAVGPMEGWPDWARSLYQRISHRADALRASLGTAGPPGWD
jgi:Ser/Thr protein kinase RdoA (MazF antagonist)